MSEPARAASNVACRSSSAVIAAREGKKGWPDRGVLVQSTAMDTVIRWNFCFQVMIGLPRAQWMSADCLTQASNTVRPREAILHGQPEQYLVHSFAWVDQLREDAGSDDCLNNVDLSDVCERNREVCTKESSALQ